MKQPKEAFEPAPPGWRWEGDWMKSPELSIAFEPDEGLDEWTEDIFEYQLRYPLGHWPESSDSYWADVVSEGEAKMLILRALTFFNLYLDLSIIYGMVLCV